MSKDWIERAVEESAALKAAAERRYTHLVNKPRPWIAGPTKQPSR